MGIKANITSFSLLLLLSSLAEAAQQPNGNVFDIRKYGAKADGNSDISQALLNAWKAACASPRASKVLIPSGTYKLGPVRLAGPCKASVKVKVLGTLRAPSDPTTFRDDGWVRFEHIDRFTLCGGGIFDGQGARTWAQNDCAKTGKCKLPINIRFDYITNSVIRDITSKDSKFFHMNLLGCNNVRLQHVTISAPGTSLNTDGIHIGRSTKINITDSNIQTGDDCVSLGDGSKGITVTRVTCGPGHGISVGSLGKYPNEEDVVGVTVKNCTLIKTMNGVRVKTWPASYNGIASDMHFEDIIMKDVQNPVILDQEYCPYNQCKQQIPSRVKISNVSFKNIRGTSSSPLAVKLVCSRGFPCQNVQIGDINIVNKGPGGPAKAQCAHLKPTMLGKQTPAILNCA